MEVKNILFIDGYGPCAIISLLQALIHLPYAIYSLNDMDLFYVGLTHTGEGCEKQWMIFIKLFQYLFIHKSTFVFCIKWSRFRSVKDMPFTNTAFLALDHFLNKSCISHTLQATAGRLIRLGSLHWDINPLSITPSQHIDLLLTVALPVVSFLCS